jgi:hypothetical protein
VLWKYLTVPGGRLDETRTAAVEIFEVSPDLDLATDPVSLVERLIEETATTVGINWE